MSKRLGIFLSISLVSLLAHAQWSQKDSLSLRHILNTDGEIKLNPNVVKEIDFGTFIGDQMSVDEKPALNFDVTLPKVFPEKAKVKLTLRPYTASTKYNYDPIYMRKIHVTKDTWKYGDQDARSEAWKENGGFHMKMAYIYSNWAKKPSDAGYRKSVEEIEATGLRYNPLANRANNVAVGAWGPASGPGSLDLMKPFTKEFWDKTGRKNRARTLELLQNYGDSITVQVNEEIKKAVVH